MSVLPNARIRPPLLDRLSDNAPDQTREAVQDRFATVPQVRESVVRDLTWLLNCVCLSSVQDLAAFPLAARSVINLGLPALSGRTKSGIDAARLEAQLTQAIVDFEPRFEPGSVRVKLESKTSAGPGTLQFVIEAKLVMRPLPVGMWLRTEIDLETGTAQITQVDGRR